MAGLVRSCGGGKRGVVWMRLETCCGGESGGCVQCAGCFDTACGFAGTDGESVQYDGAAGG
jgi:hypothetical protein